MTGRYWYVGRGSDRMGPFTDHQITEFARTGMVATTDFLWRSDVGEWETAAPIVNAVRQAHEPVAARSPTAAPLKKAPRNPAVAAATSPKAQSHKLAKRLALIVPVLGVLAGALDFLKPVTEGLLGFSGMGTYFGFGIVGLASCALAMRVAWFAEWRDALYVSAWASAAMIAFSAYPVIGAWTNPAIAERGVIAAGSKDAESAQNMLLQRMGQRVAHIQEGVGRIESRVDDIKRATTESAEKVAKVAQDVSELKGGADPRAVATKTLEARGARLDNAGFIKAYAENHDLVEHFETLGIKGDRESLVSAFDAYDASSQQIMMLMHLVTSAPPDHYAYALRTEIRNLLQSIRKTKDVTSLRTQVCTGQPVSFSTRLLRKRLQSGCANESEWTEQVVPALAELALQLDQDNYTWWGVYAPREIRFKPVATSIKSITADQLIAATQGRSTIRKQTVQADVVIAVYDHENGTGAIDLFAGNNQFATGILQAEAIADIQTPGCFIKLTGNYWNLDDQARQRKPKCRARVTVTIGSDGNIKLVSVTDARPVR